MANDPNVTTDPNGGVILHVTLGRAPLNVLPDALQAAQALIEETLQAAIDGMAIVWLVARVPLDTPAEVRRELVRRAGAELSALNEPLMPKLCARARAEGGDLDTPYHPMPCLDCGAGL